MSGKLHAPTLRFTRGEGCACGIWCSRIGRGGVVREGRITAVGFIRCARARAHGEVEVEVEVETAVRVAVAVAAAAAVVQVAVAVEVRPG